MRISIVVLIITLLAGTQDLAQVPSPMKDTGLTCHVIFWRSGQNGRVNEATTTIIINGQPMLILTGGQASGIYHEPGSFSYSAESENPFKGLNEKKNKWKSPIYPLTVSQGETILLEVYPYAQHGSFMGPWRIRQIKRWKSPTK
jgi:hypothetical protein